MDGRDTLKSLSQNSKELIYSAAPYWLQNIILNLESFRIHKRRYSKKYVETYKNISENTFLSKRDLTNYQEAMLRSFLKSAADTHFWSDKFRLYKLNIEAKDCLQEIKKLPILSKKEVKENIDKIVNKKFLSLNNYSFAHTSGTTGSGLIFPQTNHMEQVTWATWWRYRNVHNISNKNLCGYFGGRKILKTRQTTTPFWIKSHPLNQLFFSGYHINADNVQSYLEAIVRHQITWLHGYPSLLSWVVKLARDKKLNYEFPALKIITTGAENLTIWQRENISTFFNAPVREHYGQAEGVANFSECKNGFLHVDEDFSLVEFIQEDFELHQIIGTNWNNYAFPLIRYRTDDLVNLGEKTCSCGNNGRIIDSVLGRSEDYIVKPNGTRIGRLDHIFKDIVNISEAQIYQKDLNNIEVRIVKLPEFSQDDYKLITEQIKKYLGSELSFEIVTFTQIPRSSNNKLKFVISDLDNNQS